MEEKEKKKEEEGGGGFKERKKEKTRKKWTRFLDEWGSTVVHEQENRDSFFGPGQTNQHTKAEARIGN